MRPLALRHRLSYNRPECDKVSKRGVTPIRDGMDQSDGMPPCGERIRILVVNLVATNRVIG